MADKRPWYSAGGWYIAAGLTALGFAVWRRKDVEEGVSMAYNTIKKAVFSGNYGGDRSKVTTVVVHTSEGTAASALSWFGMDHKPSGQGPTSAHYLIGKDGKIYSLVPEGKIAYHAGNWDVNVKSIGIELEGKSADPSIFTVPMLASLVILVRDICRRFGIPMDRQHIIGHNEVPGATHTDPGKYFPWEKFMTTLTGGNVA
jgi:N-acetyl-anhydromuramyl-L-alanine amidase AmpD